MSQYFKADDGTLHEFPDDATPAEIDAATRAAWKPTKRTPADLQANAANYQAAHPVTDDMSFGQKFDAGMGKSLYDTAQGLQQVGADVMDYVDPRKKNLRDLVTGQDNSRSAPIQAQVDERRNIDSALMDTGAGQIGNGVGITGQMLLPGADAGKAIAWTGRGAKLLKAAVQGGAFAASQPVATGESRAKNAAEGVVFSAAGQGISDTLGAAARGTVSRLSKPARDLAQKAEAHGINLGVSQLSQNPLVRTVTSQMERLPFSGAGKRAEARQDAFNRAVGKTFGADESKITPDVFAKAKDDIGDVFNRLTARNDLQATPQLMQALRAAKDTAAREGSTDAEKMVSAQVNNLIAKARNGVIDGKAYQAFDSELGQLVKQGGNPGHHLAKLREVVRDAMDQSISKADKAEWTFARKQYAALKTVEPLVAKATAGDISPAALMQRVTAGKAGTARMATGGGTLGDLARIGQRHLKEAPNSGTADRQAVMRAIGSLGAAGGIYEAQSHGLISPTQAAGIGGLLLANRVGLKALSSKALVQGNSRTLRGLSRVVEKSQPQKLMTMAEIVGLHRKKKED